jgi:hypothetical protein
MPGKIITSNIHFDSAGSSRVSGANDRIIFTAGAGSSLILSNIQTSISCNTFNLPTTVGITGSMSVNNNANVSNNLIVSGDANFASGAPLKVQGNVYVTGAANTANLLVGGIMYAKAGAWERFSINVASASANVKIRNIPSRFSQLRLTFIGLVPQTNNTYPIVKLSTDNGATSNSTGYIGYNWRHADTATLSIPSGNVRTWETSSITLNGAEHSYTHYQNNDPLFIGYTAELILDSFGVAQKTKIHGQFMFKGPQNPRGANLALGISQGMWNHQVVNNALDIYYEGSTFSGTIVLDGLQA